MTDNKYEREKWIIELQVMRMCTMHDDENVNRAVAGFSWIQNKLLKRCVLRACLNDGVEFMEQISWRDCPRLPQLSGICCLPACGISPPSLTSKPSSKLSFFNRHFHKSRQTMMCVCVCVCACMHVCVCKGKLCLCLCVYLCEWCVLAH